MDNFVADAVLLAQTARQMFGDETTPLVTNHRQHLICWLVARFLERKADDHVMPFARGIGACSAIETAR